MAIDLAMDNNGDLIFSGSRDLMTVMDQEQVEQRIRLRLMLPRGSFTHDSSGSLGSELYTSLRHVKTGSPRILSDLSFRVQEALATMDEIEVQDVTMEFSEDTRQLSVTVHYQMTPVVEDAATLGSDDPDSLLDMTLTFATEE